MNKKNIRKILFILPPLDQRSAGFETYNEFLDRMGPYPPLGLFSLGHAIKSKIQEIDVKILDGQCLSKDDIIKQMERYLPDLVGISSSSRTYLITLEIARLVKSWGSQVILGGSHASGLAKEILLNRGPSSKDYCIDAVVKEDGEEAIYQFIQRRDYQKISNLVWQNNSGRVIENRIRNVDINKIGLIDRNIGDMESYFRRQQEPNQSNRFKRGLTMISQKGCAWRYESGGCIFCSRMNKEINIKNPENFWRETTDLVNNYNVDLIWDTRDDFLENEKWLEDLVATRPSFEKLDNVRLQSFARIDNVNKKSIKLLENLNIPLVFVIGFESGNNKMLKAMNKGFSMRESLRSLELLKKSGIWIAASFVLGAPGENKKSLLDTLNFAEKLRGFDIRISSHILEPLPNSRAFDLVRIKNKSKYMNQDLINIHDLTKDWISNFCEADWNEILKVYQEFEKLN